MASTLVNIGVGLLSSGTIAVSAYNLSGGEKNSYAGPPTVKVVEIKLDEPVKEEGAKFKTIAKSLKLNTTTEKSGTNKENETANGKEFYEAMMESVKKKNIVFSPNDKIGVRPIVQTVSVKSRLEYTAKPKPGTAFKASLDVFPKTKPPLYSVSLGRTSGDTTIRHKVNSEWLVGKKLTVSLKAVPETAASIAPSGPQSIDVNPIKFQSHKFDWMVTPKVEGGQFSLAAKVETFDVNGIPKTFELKSGPLSVAYKKEPAKEKAGYSLWHLLLVGGITGVLGVGISAIRQKKPTPVVAKETPNEKPASLTPTQKKYIKQAQDFLDKTEFDLALDALRKSKAFDPIALSRLTREWNTLTMEDSRGHFTYDQMAVERNKWATAVQELIQKTERR